MCAGGVASIGEVMSGPRERCRGDVHRTQLTLARWQHAQAIHHACESIPVATTIDAPAGSYDTPSAPPMAFAWATVAFRGSSDAITMAAGLACQRTALAANFGHPC